jgi:hypothetical protein
MKTTMLAASMAAVAAIPVDAFADPCSGPYCPPAPFPPPTDLIANICNAVQDQVKKTFKDAESACNYSYVTGAEWEISWPQGWCTLSEWHDGSFSIDLKSQSINSQISRIRTPEPHDYINFTLDAAIDCFFDSTYQWQCGYQYSVFEFDREHGPTYAWAGIVTNRSRQIAYDCYNRAWASGGDINSIMIYFSKCNNSELRINLEDFEHAFAPKLESDLLPAVNQIANTMLH